MADGLIAATAAAHTKIIGTRKVDDFSDTRIPVINPWNQQGYGCFLRTLTRGKVRCAKLGKMVARQPPAVGLVINLKTAKMLDLTIPPAILDPDDEVIE
jgi:hypothetical protein